MDKLIVLFDKHTANVTSGQKVVNEMMDTAKVKTYADADKVRAAYRKHLDSSIHRRNNAIFTETSKAKSILAVFTTRMNRWMRENKIAPKAQRGGRRAKVKVAATPKAATVATVAKGSPSATIAKAANVATLQSVNTFSDIEARLRAMVSGMKKADIVSIQSKVNAIFTLALKSAK